MAYTIPRILNSENSAYAPKNIIIMALVHFSNPGSATLCMLCSPIAGFKKKQISDVHFYNHNNDVNFKV